ncbi:hypothetical protein ACFS07_24575 [Undibacterium arcticum]
MQIIQSGLFTNQRIRGINMAKMTAAQAAAYVLEKKKALAKHLVFQVPQSIHFTLR